MFFALSTLLCAALLVKADVSPQQKYIDQYAALAVSEMYRSGVPASITLAQGLIESRYGLSELATKGNNHFGIKCHDWKGKTMRVDDDKKGECFRVYDKVEYSFQDHSDFLRYRDRYKSLFDNDITDYKAWAVGLKKAGYATDPQYATKLIKVIEDYGLYRFDTMKPSDEIVTEMPAAASAGENAPVQEKTKKPIFKSKKNKNVEEVIPASPTALEEDVKLVSKEMEEFKFSLSRPVYTRNGVPFIYSVEGDTYSAIAESNGIFVEELLKFNDMTVVNRPLPGTVIYLKPKKNQTEKGLDKYIVEQEGEILRDICQRFAVKEKSIIKINGFAAGHVLHEGDTVRLRKR